MQAAWRLGRAAVGAARRSGLWLVSVRRQACLLLRQPQAAGRFRTPALQGLADAAGCVEGAGLPDTFLVAVVRKDARVAAADVYEGFTLALRLVKQVGPRRRGRA